MNSNKQNFLVIFAKLILATLFIFAFVVFTSIASAQILLPPSENSNNYMFSCSISDEEATIVFKSNTARGCVGELIRRSSKLGQNGKPVSCFIDTPVAYFAFKKLNDEPNKGRVHCIVSIQEAAREFDLPTMSPAPQKKTEPKNKEAKLSYY